MTDLFGNEEPAQTAKSVVYKNLSTQNPDLLPAQTAQDMGYDIANIRKKIHKGQWYFAYKDVVGVLAETRSLDSYCRDLKKRMIAEGFQWCEKISVLKMPAAGARVLADLNRLLEE